MHYIKNIGTNMTKLILVFVEEKVMLEVTVHCKTHANALSYAEFPWILVLSPCGVLLSATGRSHENERVKIHPDDVKIRVDPVDPITRTSNRQTEKDFKPVNWTFQKLAEELKVSLPGLMMTEYTASYII
jgi:hypothetical protein